MRARKRGTVANCTMERRLVRRTLFVATLLLVTLSAGTVGFSLTEGWGTFDAFYMTLTTITTVGNEHAKPLSRAGQIFNSFVILFGVTAMFVAVGAMTQTIIEIEFSDRAGRKRKRMVENLDGHFIVCGFGRVGRNASKELQENSAAFVIIDRNEHRVARAEDAGMLAMVADATNDDDLRKAGVLRARGLIAALPSDAENLFIILSAKGLNPGLTVVTRASEEQNEAKLRAAGADTVFSPYSVAGRRLADSLLRPKVMEFLNFTLSSVDPQIMMEQLRVGGSAQSGPKVLKTLLGASGLNVIVLAVHRANGQKNFNPPPDCEIAAGDVLIVMSDKASLLKLEQILR